MTEHNDNQVIVSISCITYNHAPYIRQCLDGFLMQQTNFAYEVLIHDDASTDGTTEIIKEYETKYPDIIKPIYEDENQWVKGRRGSAVFNFPRARGKYIALCEGDDYWTDPMKLQKQVDYLDAHRDLAMCSHICCSYHEATQNLVKKESFNDKKYTLEQLLKWEWLFQTHTVMFPVDKLKQTKINDYKEVTDVVLFYELLKQGSGIQLKDCMGVYRWHKEGVWSMVSMNNMREQEFRIRLGIYNHEETDDAATFILAMYSKPISRLWLIENYNVLMSSCQIICKHFGLLFTVNLLINKFLFNRRYSLL